MRQQRPRWLFCAPLGFLCVFLNSKLVFAKDPEVSILERTYIQSCSYFSSVNSEIELSFVDDDPTIESITLHYATGLQSMDPNNSKTLWSDWSHPKLILIPRNEKKPHVYAYALELQRWSRGSFEKIQELQIRLIINHKDGTKKVIPTGKDPDRMSFWTVVLPTENLPCTSNKASEQKTPLESRKVEIKSISVLEKSHFKINSKSRP